MSRPPTQTPIILSVREAFAERNIPPSAGVTISHSDKLNMETEKGKNRLSIYGAAEVVPVIAVIPTCL